jgi:uncharacterized protein
MPNPVMHFEVMARDNVEQVRKFYADAFDWQIDANNPMNYGLVETGGDGIRGGIGKPMDGPSYATFYVHVADIDAMLKRIGSLGGTALMPKMEVPGQNIFIAMFKDPAGNPIGLVQSK